MKLPFKLTGENKKVGDTNFKEHYPTVNISMLWATLSPFVRQAIETYIIPYIGQEMYDEIVDSYDAGDTLSDDQKYFLLKLQDAVAYYTIVLSMPHMNVVVSDQGVQQNASKEGTSNPASQWSFKNAIWAAGKAADQHMDMLLKFMEEKIATSGNTSFDTWKDSPSYTSGSSSLFKTTAEFQKYVDIKNSRRTFLILLSSISEASEAHLRPVLCQELYEDILNKYKTNGVFTSYETATLKLSVKMLAYYSMLEALPTLQCIIEGDGVKTVTYTDGMDVKNFASFESINALTIVYEKRAKKAKAELLAYIQANADNLTLYTRSGAAKTYYTQDAKPGGIWV